jgi:hypothetical protein
MKEGKQDGEPRRRYRWPMLFARTKSQGMVELAKPEFTPELKFRGSEFEKSSIKVRSK